MADMPETKPATDAMIESDRAVYGGMPGHHKARYIARIDAERSRADTLEARVKVLEEALRSILAVTRKTRSRDADRANDYARAALKAREAGNG